MAKVNKNNIAGKHGLRFGIKDGIVVPDTMGNLGKDATDTTRRIAKEVLRARIASSNGNTNSL